MSEEFESNFASLLTSHYEKAQPLRTLIGYLKGKQFHVNAKVIPEVLLSENTVEVVDSTR